ELQSSINLPIWARPRRSLLRKSFWDWGCLGLWPIYATKPMPRATTPNAKAEAVCRFSMKLLDPIFEK
ncbi:MAG: hypothetical protein ACK4OH_15070, partial [Acidovorax temperans]|uniref:hypothetical protein n=1 Tax=Acidovorax temperans TaxID=80878 RepID=UPI003919F18A